MHTSSIHRNHKNLSKLFHKEANVCAREKLYFNTYAIRKLFLHQPPEKFLCDAMLGNGTVSDHSHLARDTPAR